MSQKTLCPECNALLEEIQVERLRNGEIVYCSSCGRALQINVSQNSTRKEVGLGAGLKKLGKKIGQDIVKVSTAIDGKIKEKLAEKQDQPHANTPHPTSHPQRTETATSSTSIPPSSPQPPPVSKNPPSMQGRNPAAGVKGFLKGVYTKMQPLSQEAMEERMLRNQAKRNVINTQFFRMHLLAYILVNLLILVINLVVSPSYWFFMWVTTGWGILLLIHAFRYFDSRKKQPSGFFLENLYYFIIFNAYFFFIDTFDGQSFSDPVDFAINIVIIWGGFLLLVYIFKFYWGSESVKREMAMSNKPDLLKKPVIITNILMFLVFNGLAFLADILFTLGEKWYYWTFISWGIIILIQIFLSAIWGMLDFTTAGAFMLLHTIVYFSISTLLILIDAFNGSNFSDPIMWSFIPVGFWGVFFILHFIIYMIWFRSPTSKQVDEEFERLKRQRNQ